MLLGVVIGAYRPETDDFHYDMIHFKYFQDPLFKSGKYRDEACKISLELVGKFELTYNEKIKICQGDIFDKNVENNFLFRKIPN